MKAERLYKFDPKALVKLAQGTSVVIATLLAIPDSVALIPVAASPISWLLKVVAVWVSALILWFVGYLCVLHIVCWLTEGVRLGNDGIRLWRFGRLISWQSIVAVSVETQVMFSRIFSMTPPAKRLTLYIQRHPGGRLAPQAIPSFLFLANEFEALVQAIASKTFGSSPQSQDVLLAHVPDLPRLKGLYRILRWARMMVSVVIAIGLMAFLARKATVNYFYNTANKSFKQGNYSLAQRDYELVTSIDPFFAVAWQNLGGTEFHLGNMERACQCWEKALSLKPDLVEAKVSLAFIYIHSREFDKARNLLDRAIKLAPRNTAALTNLADLDMRLGHTREAVQTARLVLTVEQNNPLATCLIAQGKLRQGRAREALEILTTAKGGGVLTDRAAFCRLVEGEVRLALGQVEEAQHLFEQVLEQLPENTDALIDLAKVGIAQHDWGRADELLERACKIAKANPWTWIVRSNLSLRTGDKEKSKSYLARAVELTGQDAGSLAASARLALDLGQRSEAKELAGRAVKLEPVTPEAIAVLETISATE